MKEIYLLRQEKVRAFLAESEIDSAVIMSQANIYYLTGLEIEAHERFLALVVHKEEPKTSLYLPTLDLETANKTACVDSFITVSDTENGYMKFREHVGDKLVLAIEKEYVTVSEYDSFVNYYPTATFLNIGEFMLTLREQKSVEESEKVRAAIQMTEKGLDNVLEKLEAGMTELDVKALLEYELTKLGAEGFAFDTTVLTGENSALPHGASGDLVLKAGDFLLMDFGIKLKGYCSDITRTFMIGSGTTEQKAMYETVLAANQKAIAAVKVGVALKEIDLVARKVIEEAGYGEYFTHRIGHGMGIDVHEQPSIHHENEAVVEPGLLFTIEPGIYVPGVGGVRIEDDLYVTMKGDVEVLTTYPKKLRYI